jgi:hypothetical protein
MYRTLEAIADNTELTSVLRFKGGTCASMLGWLDRFSVDLDFDYVGSTDNDNIIATRKALEVVAQDHGLTVKDWSKKGIQYFFRYDSQGVQRNTLKVEASFPVIKENGYAPMRFTEIDRILKCQTIETMFAHKLLTPIERFERTGHIAGRDIYDVHHFFLKGYSYDPAIIQTSRGTDTMTFLKQLADFIENNVTDTIIREDLSFLLSLDRFTILRKVLKRETITCLNDEIKRLGAII